MKLQEIAHFLNLETEHEQDILTLSTLKEATKRDISFFDNKKYLQDLKETKAGVVLIEKEFVDHLPSTAIPLVSKEPYLSMARLTKLFVKPLIRELKESTIGENLLRQSNVHIGKGCQIGNNVTLMSGVHIGDNVSIGNDVVLYPNVVIYNDTVIKDNVFIQAGSVIGSDGFGYAHTKTGEHVKIYHLGNVIVEEEVEIGSNSSVDRAVFGSTIIKKGAKIDNLVQIAHNCEIGEYSIIVAQSGISGSSKLGRNVVMGGQSAAAGHLSIAPFTTIAARGGVTKSIKEADTYSGFPLMKHKAWLRLQAVISKLGK